MVGDLVVLALHARKLIAARVQGVILVKHVRDLIGRPGWRMKPSRLIAATGFGDRWIWILSDFFKIEFNTAKTRLGLIQIDAVTPLFVAFRKRRAQHQVENFVITFVLAGVFAGFLGWAFSVTIIPFWRLKHCSVDGGYLGLLAFET